MPNIFSGMGGFGRGMVSAGSAAGTAYRGWQDMQQRQLDAQIARQRMQLEQQQQALAEKREGLEENEFGLKVYNQSQQLLTDAMERQRLSEMLSTLANTPKIDPALSFKYKAGAMALANGVDWPQVSQVLGLDAKNLLDQLRGLGYLAGAGEKEAKGGFERAETNVLNKVAPTINPAPSGSSGASGGISSFGSTSSAGLTPPAKRTPGDFTGTKDGPYKADNGKRYHVRAGRLYDDATGKVCDAEGNPI